MKMRMSTRGRITLPKHLRDRYGFLAGDPVAISLQGDCILIKRVSEASRVEQNTPSPLEEHELSNMPFSASALDKRKSDP